MSTEVKNLGFNSFCIVTANQFLKKAEDGQPCDSRGYKVDKNGNLPILLDTVAGKNINANVISGTQAELLGIKVGNTYGIQITETDPTEYEGKMTRQFRFAVKFHYTSFIAIQSEAKEMGAPSLEIVRPVREIDPAGATSGKGGNPFKGTTF